MLMLCRTCYFLSVNDFETNIITFKIVHRKKITCTTQHQHPTSGITKFLFMALKECRRRRRHSRRRQQQHSL